MKKTNFLFVLFLSFISMAFAQEPVKWDFSTKKINDSISELQLRVKLEPGWHLYSQKTKGTELPTVFEFDASKHYERIGGVRESAYKSEYDRFEKDTARFFEDEALFRQRIKVKSESDFQIKGMVTFQLCEKGSCIPPDDVEFAFDIKGRPMLEVSSSDADGKEIAHAGDLEDEEGEEDEEDIEALDQESEAKVIAAGNEDFTRDRSFWMIFFVSFGAGLLALITPCVFPMIPMTISFFMKGGEDNKKSGLKQAYFFGGSIIFMFAILGLTLTLLLGKDAMYIISTHWIPNTLFFVIFMVFAFSFFGMFDIALPSSWINKSDEKADKGGYLGAFFIALTTVLVSFSCTGPILGAALIEMASGSSNSLVFFISMIGFAFGFALPFTLLAMFPSVITKMKGGSWLNTVKIVFGFLEVALGLKFLSMADLSAGWGILDRETYLALWIVVFTLLGFYFLGKLKFKGDSDVEIISVGRIFAAIITFSFVVYMVPGMFGAPLKAISGYIPPPSTQDFDLERIIFENTSRGGGGGTVSYDDIPMDRKYVNELSLPTGFTGFFDLEEAKEYARKVGKPMFVDFTGKTCANCREMENYVWVDQNVRKILNDDYVMVALYCDINTIELPEEEWVTLDNGRVLKTLGKRNHNYQIESFTANAQPLYVLMDADENLLAKPKGYDRSISNFVKFLEEGKSNFKK